MGHRAYKVSAPARVMGTFTRGDCPRCGKRCYATRRDAKRKGKTDFPGSHMGVYSCGDWFHVTSEPQRKKEARREVSERNKNQVVPVVPAVRGEADTAGDAGVQEVQGEGGEVKEEENFLEQALNEMYEKAENEDAIPWNDAEAVTIDGGRVVIIRDFETFDRMLDEALAEQRAELEETFPED